MAGRLQMFGLGHCSTCQKAQAELEAAGWQVDFRDVKTDPLSGADWQALIVGRAFAGFLMDRMFVPYVAVAILAFPVFGVGLLALGATGPLAMLAAVCLGLAAGAELDVLAVLISRYFGTRAYAENYGWQYAAWALGSGTAPLVTNMVFDRTGSHQPALLAYLALFALAAVLVLRLGPYPQLPAATRSP